MPLLQPRLNLKVAQRQILTPGLMQMVSLLALNKLELTEMINAEMIENPVLEEIDESVPILDEVGGKEAMRDRVEEAPPVTVKDPFEEIDFGSYFQEYLDPGFRTTQEYEESDKPSFEQFLSQPTTLTDHLEWQLGSMVLDPQIRDAAEYLIGNLDENGYLSAPLEDLAEVYAEGDANGPVMDLLRKALDVIQRLDPIGIGALDLKDCLRIQLEAQRRELELVFARQGNQAKPGKESLQTISQVEKWDHPENDSEDLTDAVAGALEEDLRPLAYVVDPSAAPLSNGHAVSGDVANGHHYHSKGHFTLNVAASLDDGFHAREEDVLRNRRQSFETAIAIVLNCLPLLQKRDLREISRAVGAPIPEISSAIELIRTLDPRPGLRYNREQARLIEPDVAFVKRGDTWAVAMNEEDMPSFRLSQRYRRMLTSEGTDKEVKDYVKERFRSAMQLMRNIAQRKSTILRTCEVIVRRQQDFLEHGIEALRPMMIKEVAEEIGVHPSTVSRAVANKYAHTPQGVIELRAFFSEGANGPEGADTPLVVLKRMVRKLIEDEDPRRPLTDDQLATMLQARGIQVTRRTVAKYREDMNISSTHQRRRREV
ncbi:RNA polymerase sigma-54 factor [Acidicapsa dinghuensis]|uniref:RNA polymerase sigma-54 factor n=1 Tax=Acidicapsa dinghuensis TaxID=2218256 RepID=A0ABW1EJM9_9BACT|nr:RNA polymerase sigma-54 factor [Acidicapsa dinghuensis]